MNNYFDNISLELKDYFNILSNEIPEFLIEYVNTPIMRKQESISVSCGTYYSDLFDVKWYSSLDHSVAVALIIWRFTHDKVQTLAGLFHDVSTPAFKHTIDIMNGDYEKQESTEIGTESMIANSNEVMALLTRDGVDIKDIYDYHIYPIADNDTPQLSSDRLEYTLSNGFGVRYPLWNLDEIKEIYDDLEVQKNEDGIDELGFKSKKLAEKFVNNMSKLSAGYISDETRFSMQFIADTLKILNQNGCIQVQDLYDLSEKEVIDIIEKSDIPHIKKNFDEWRNARFIRYSDIPIDENGKYCTKVEKAKIRYINPLVRVDGNIYKRISDVSNDAKDVIETTKSQTISKKYMYI